MALQSFESFAESSIAFILFCLLGANDLKRSALHYFRTAVHLRIDL